MEIIMPRPNILLIFTDQQRGDTIHAAGNPVIKTPHLDRLVREGVTFTNAFSPSPVCVSARCSLIHGQYPHRTGCTDNGDPMPTDRPTLMSLLAEAGYRTHGVGKMHFTPDGQALRGFQTRERQEELLRRLEDDDYVPYLRANGYSHVLDPMGPRGEMYYIPQVSQVPARLHATQWVGDRSEAFIREHARTREDAREGGDRPFFLFSSYIHPHPPFAPPTPWNKLYRGPLMPLPKRPAQREALWTWANRHQNRYKYRDNGIDDNLLRVIKAHYYACISFVDYQVGRLLAALEETGMLDDTLILFASDHGELLGDYDCFGKRSMLDSAARVPLLARLPGRFRAGATCDAATSLVDIMPTALAAAGVPAGGASLDGLDLAEVAERADLAGRTVYSQFQRRGLGVYMGVNREHKYYYSAPDRREFYFSRVEDPDETRNRAGLSFCRGEVEAARCGLIEYLRAGGYEEPLEGASWREFPAPPDPAGPDPDAGLLVQDAPWSLPLQRIPGYTE
jgi:arylsulfatase